jgi:voltage-gated potassium channel
VAARWRYALYVLGRIAPFFGIFLAVWLIAAVAFYLLDAGAVSLGNAVYWSMVTLGTVGYGDIVPTTNAAKALTIGVVLTQVFLLGYLVSVITGAVTEESQRRALGTYGTDLTDHIIVLGYSPVGRAAVRELLVQEQKVAVVVERPEDIPNVRALGSESRLFVTYGQPGQPEILERCNVRAAHSVIICSGDDTVNLVSALNIRSANPKARIVVSVGSPELRETLQAAGVTYVASPSDLGGRLCASAAFEPEVAIAIEDLTAADIRSDIREYLLRETTPIARQTFGEAEALVRQRTGCLLIGYARPKEGIFDTFVAPPPESKLEPGDAILILGTIPNAHNFTRWFGEDQGR